MDNQSFSKRLLLIVLPVCIALSGILYVDRTSVFSYGYTLLLFFAINRFLLDKNELQRNFFYFHYYLAFAIAFFCIFRYQLPEYLGLTGPEGGVGTDDVRYYAQVVHGKNIFYTIQVSVDDIYSFSKFLLFIYPFEIFTPLNIIIVNLLGVCFIPYFIRKLSYEFFHDQQLSNKAATLSLLCPYTTYFGCIIMRDTLTATLVIAAMLFFMQKKFIRFALLTSLLLWIRFGTTAFLVMGIIALLRKSIAIKHRQIVFFNILIITIIVVFYFSFDYIQSLSDGKLSENLIRDTNNDFFRGTTIAKLLALPFPINVMASALFFFVVPVLEIPQPSSITGYYLVSSIFSGFLTPFFFFFLWYPMFNAIFSYFSKKDRNLETLLIIVLTFCFVLGTFSLQIRHKTVLYPFLCLLGAYGIHRFDKYEKNNAFTLAAAMITIQIILAIKTFV